ncbi:MAG: sulfotransferase [Bacteroidales bacterium]|nr:sulfotransferase [Bacteroidales bacterium]
MGAPRSGTTMLASMLASRQDIITLPEMHYIHELLKEEIVFGKVSKKKIFSTLKKHYMFKDLSIIKNDNDIYNLIGHNVVETIKNIIDAYNIKTTHKEYKYWVEHTPHNHRYFDVLQKQFPNAKFIHIIRDGRAVYLSTKEVDWGYKDIISGAQNWYDNVFDCIVKENIYPDMIKTIKYENLTKNPHDELKQLCVFLGIEYEESMLNGKGLIKPSYAKYSKAIGEKAHTKSLNKWKKTLKMYEIMHFNAICKKLLIKFNYLDSNDLIFEIKHIKKFSIQICGIIKKMYYSYKAKKRLNRDKQSLI